MAAIIEPAPAFLADLLGARGELEDLAPFQVGTLDVVRIEERGGGGVEVA